MKYLAALILSGCASLPPPEEVAKTCPDNRARNGWHEGFEWYAYRSPSTAIHYEIVEPSQVPLRCPRYAGFTTHACFTRTSDVCWVTLAQGYTREHVCHEKDHCDGMAHK